MLPTALASASALGALADASAPDKAGQSLLNPTPAAFLRELSTDRPDKTESPYTVDAGHFQLEMDLATCTWNRDTRHGADTRTTAWAVAPLNLKAGLLPDVDLQLVIETWNHVRTEDRIAGTVLRQSGFGDLTVRVKKNFWGNEGGPTALGLMPFVKLPTNEDQLGNHAVEGGLILPLAVELPAGWGLGLMTEADFRRDEAGSGHHAAFIHSATFSQDLVGRLGGYAEFFSEVSTETGADWIGTVDLGLTYGLTDNLQLDLGVNIGVTDSAEDLSPFVGLSCRF
jgi:hypothetical protein